MLVYQVQHDEPRALRSLNDRIPRDLETIALKCMEKEPSQRYSTAEDLAADLRRWLTGEPIHARPIGRVQRAWRWCKRKPLAAGLLTTLALLVIVLGTAAGLIGSFYQREATLAKSNENLAKNEGKARREAEFLAARQMFEHGWVTYQQGNLRHGLLLIARSLTNLETLGNPSAPGHVPAIPGALSLARSVREHLSHAFLALNCPRSCFTHHSGVTAIAFSPDGTRLATASYDKTAQLWDVATGNLIGKALKHDGRVQAVAFSPDGKKLATASLDRIFRRSRWGFRGGFG